MVEDGEEEEEVSLDDSKIVLDTCKFKAASWHKCFEKSFVE